MRLVVDANILFAVLIKSGVTEDLMIFGDFDLFAPRFLFEEFSKYKNLILDKSRRSNSEFDILLDILRRKIKIVSRENFENFFGKARDFCPDENDVEYFALALKLNCGIWSNDKRLKNQEIIKIYSTNDLLENLEGSR